MFERFSRSWSLVKASADVLRQDKELLVFPLLSTIAALLVAATFIAPDTRSGFMPSLYACSRIARSSASLMTRRRSSGDISMIS